MIQIRHLALNKNSHKLTKQQIKSVFSTEII